MRKYLVPAVMAACLAAFAVVFVAPARAEDEAAEKKEKKPAARQYTGVVDAIDAAAKTITLKKKDGEMKTFTLTDDVKCYDGEKKEVEVGFFKVGDRAMVKYREADGKAMAHRVLVPKAKKDKDDKEHEEKEEKEESSK